MGDADPYEMNARLEAAEAEAEAVAMSENKDGEAAVDEMTIEEVSSHGLVAAKTVAMSDNKDDEVVASVGELGNDEVEMAYIAENEGLELPIRTQHLAQRHSY